MKRRTLSDPIPGFDEGRPLPPGAPAESAARAALRRAWAGRFLADAGSPHRDGQLVLDDLARFCHGDETVARMDGAGRADPIAMAIAEGRRQAFLFIKGRLGLLRKGSTKP